MSLRLIVIVILVIITTFIDESRARKALETMGHPMINQAMVSSCGRTCLFLLEDPSYGLPQTIHNPLIIGTRDIHGNEMLLVEAGRANEFFKELLLGLRGAGADEQVTIRP